MAYPSWPAGVPYLPTLSTWQIERPYVLPMVTEFEDHSVEMLPVTTARLAVVKGTILMPLSAFATFRAFAETTLFNGTQWFNMPIYNGSAIATKLCQIVGGAYATRSAGSRIAVSMRLTVRDL